MLSTVIFFSTRLNAEERLLALSMPGSFGCRVGSIPDIIAKIASILATNLRDCSWNNWVGKSLLCKIT